MTTENTPFEPETSVAKAFFDTTAGRRTAGGLVAFGAIGAVAGTFTGDASLAGFAAMLFSAATFRGLVPSHELAPIKSQLLVAFGAAVVCTIAAGSAHIVRNTREESARIAALPEADSAEVMTVTRKEFECHNKPKGAVIVLPAKNAPDAKKLLC